MRSQLQLRYPFQRPPSACIVPHKSRIHNSSVNLALGNLPDRDIDGSKAGGSGRPRGKSKAVVYATGLGIASAGLYYVLVNGPSRSAPASSTAPLSPTHFTPLTLTASVSCTPYTKLLTFSLPPHLIPDATGPRTSPIFSIYVKDSDIQIERPYTPLEGIDARGQMHFWVKRYQGGEVGRWLHERKVGDQVEVRGPVRNWEWRDEEWDEIVMISGGTGITPFYQLLYSLFSTDSEKALPRTRFTLLHSSPTPSDLPPSALLDHLQTYAQSHPDLFSLRLFVDTADPKPARQDLPTLAVGRIGRRALDQALMHLAPKASPWWSRFWVSSAPPNLADKKMLFLVCGPEPMTAAIAGPRTRNLGRIGGILGEMGVSSKQVWKL